MEHHHSPAISINSRREDARAQGKAWAKRVNARNAWHKLVLTLDGGGIRGYSELLILQELMIRIVAWEYTINERIIDVNDVLPCHYFDYIWGTSTGGLIALMLGRLRMSVPQALEIYRSLGDSIFGSKRPENAGGLNPFATKYHHGRLKEAVITITKDYCKMDNDCSGHDKLLWPDQADGVDNCWNICQAVCITARSAQGNSQAQPLRSYEYEHPGTLLSPDPYAGVQDLDLEIWEAGRATSAAPFYFKMFEKPDQTGKPRRYKDGGILLNNPAEIALNEVRDRHATPHLVLPAVLLSIGTGIRNGTPFAELNEQQLRGARIRKDVAFPKALWRKLKTSFYENKALFRHVLVRYTEGEAIHRGLRQSVANDNTWYRRLNVDEGLGEMKLGEWRAGKWYNPVTGAHEQHSGGKTLTTLESATHTYLNRTQVREEHGIEWNLLPSEHLDQLAERLVRHRTERRRLVVTDEDRKRWHTHQGRWATGRRTDPWDDWSCDKPLVRPLPRNNAL